MAFGTGLGHDVLDLDAKGVWPMQSTFTTMGRCAARIAATVIILACLSPSALPAQELRFPLENGLRVILIPAGEIPLTPKSRVAVVMLFDIGESHDSEGRAGMAHLVEHLYVTSAAGDAPARTAEEWFQRHEGQANAQTGRDYTVIAAVASPDRLETELQDAAARLGGVRVESADLERELPRMRLELANMYGGIPSLAARNRAHNAIDPLPGGVPKGGDVRQLEGIEIDEIRARIRVHYVPERARLIVAGAFSAEETRAKIEELFGKIPRPDLEPLPLRNPPKSRVGEQIQVATGGASSPRVVARLWAAPALTEAGAAAYLLYGAKFLQVAPAHGVTPVFTPIDDPRVFGGIVTAAEGESAAAALGHIDRALAAALKVEGPIPRQWAERSLDNLLSLRPPTPIMIATNPYLVAFGVGRRAQLGLDRDALVTGISEASEEDLAKLRETTLHSARSVTVSIGFPSTSSTPKSEGNEE